MTSGQHQNTDNSDPDDPCLPSIPSLIQSARIQIKIDLHVYPQFQFELEMLAIFWNLLQDLEIQTEFLLLLPVHIDIYRRVLQQHCHPRRISKSTWVLLGIVRTVCKIIIGTLKEKNDKMLKTHLFAHKTKNCTTHPNKYVFRSTQQKETERKLKILKEE